MTRLTSIPTRLAVWTMGLCPLAMAILVHTGFRSVPLAIQSPSLPALAFHQHAVDLRKIHPTSETHATFVFQNRGAEPVRVTSLEPSCGCLTPRLQGDHDGIIDVTEHGRIVIRMQPANSYPGPHEYTVKVHYTDPEPREVLLTMKLEIPVATMSIDPPALDVFHPAGSEPTTKDFVITDGRGKPFDITGVSINTDLVEAAIGESSRNQLGQFQHSVRTTISGNLPPGKAQVLLRITTTDADFPELRVPILLRGPLPENPPKSDDNLDHEHRD